MGRDFGPVGARVKALRKRRGLSQDALAKRAGLHRVTLANVERGATVPTLDTLARLATALRVSVAQLLG
jgi:transcriptional regulator with XRE-family HTH domain